MGPNVAGVIRSAVALTPSMRMTLEDLGLKRIDVWHAGRDTFPLGARIRAMPAHRIGTEIEPL
jgi:hypothetical protein